VGTRSGLKNNNNWKIAISGKKGSMQDYFLTDSKYILGQGRSSFQWAKHAWLYSDLLQVEIRTRKKFLALGEACTAIF